MQHNDEHRVVAECKYCPVNTWLPCLIRTILTFVSSSYNRTTGHPKIGAFESNKLSDQQAFLAILNAAKQEPVPWMAFDKGRGEWLSRMRDDWFDTERRGILSA